MLLVESLLGSSSAAPIYIEDVFSTYLYTGTGGSQTISNGVDLSTKGGMVWIKSRSAATNNFLFDTARGAQKEINSNTTDAEATLGYSVEFLNNGFTVGNAAGIGVNAATYTSWTFRKQAKFFDVVTYTGNGAGSRSIAHSLGTKPAWIMVKRTDSTSNWFHFAWNGIDGVGGFTARSLSLNSTNAAGITTSNGTNPHTATTFDTGEISDITGTNPNVNNATYVAYLFATNAGGFGASGTDNVISCGSFTTNSNGDLSLNLGWEPQWLVLKTTSAVGPWYQYDIMRGLPVTASSSSRLSLNTSAAEVAGAESIYPTPTGLTATGQLNPNTTYIYIAIRRGPMKTPTSGTSVFSPITSSGATGTTLTTNFPVDMMLTKYRTGAASNAVVDRLRGVSTNSTERGSVIYTNSTAAESGTAGESLNWNNTGFQVPTNWGGISNVFYSFRRAPGFFDVVCYTGTGANTTVSHNLGVAPELMIVKSRNVVTSWRVYSAATGSGNGLILNNNSSSFADPSYWNSTSPTSSVFSVGTSSSTNGSGSTYVAYLFATCPGVSKVGTYTGSGTTKQIDCGFTGGARFVLIKRTDSTGDWYVWDSARGIVAGNDPYLLLNSTAAEVTSTDYIDTYSAGFEISSTAPAAINASGGSFIFLAIA